MRLIPIQAQIETVRNLVLKGAYPYILLVQELALLVNFACFDDLRVLASLVEVDTPILFHRCQMPIWDQNQLVFGLKLTLSYLRIL